MTRLALQRPLVAFDLETTGLSVREDRIVEISCVRLDPDGSRQTKTFRVNPGRPISAQASAVHGITDADVASLPPFGAIADELYGLFLGCDLTGFNVEQFDLPMLVHEFRRVELQFPEANTAVVDSFRIFQRKEPRDLASAYKLYCGRELQNAHSAEADATAAAEIVLAQVARYEDLPNCVRELHAFCHPRDPNWLDPDGKIFWRDGKARLSFGKYKDRPLDELAQENPGYLQWIAGANFSDDVVRIVTEALDGKYPQAPVGLAA